MFFSVKWAEDQAPPAEAQCIASWDAGQCPESRGVRVIILYLVFCSFANDQLESILSCLCRLDISSHTLHKNNNGLLYLWRWSWKASEIQSVVPAALEESYFCVTKQSVWLLLSPAAYLWAGHWLLGLGDSFWLEAPGEESQHLSEQPRGPGLGRVLEPQPWGAEEEMQTEQCINKYPGDWNLSD